MLEYWQCLGAGVLFGALTAALLLPVAIVTRVLAFVAAWFLSLFGEKIVLPPGVSGDNLLLLVIFAVWGFVVFPINGYYLREHVRRGDEIELLTTENHRLARKS